MVGGVVNYFWRNFDVCIKIFMLVMVVVLFCCLGVVMVVFKIYCEELKGIDIG